MFNLYNILYYIIQHQSLQCANLVGVESVLQKKLTLHPPTLQALSTSFYEREHTKPLFKLNNILCMYNLYTYHSFMEAF